MLFEFAPEVQALIDSGVYEVVRNSAGQLLGIVRDKATGQFVAHAIGMTLKKTASLAIESLATSASLPVNSLVAPIQLVMSGIHIVQTHKGFQETYRRLDVIQTGLQAFQNSMVVLQASTAVIGVGVAAGVVLSAVNLHQTLKLREDLKHLRLQVKDGFIDMKQALKDQGTEIIQRIDRVAQDVEYRHHRIILVQAYGLFTQALQRFQTALKLEDTNHKNAEINAARGMLYKALADYTNPQLLEKTCAPGQLRRLECAWAIEQAIITTYQIQNEFAAVSDRLSHLQTKIRQDSLNIINGCKTEDELDFIFPEIARIHDHDLAVLNSWQNHVEWVRSLPLEDLKLLASSNFSSSDATGETTVALTAPPEQLIYENLKQKSHPQSLELQLKFMMSPQLRLEYESYVTQQAASVGSKALISQNLQQASNLAVANLYWYFKVREDSKQGVVA